MYSSEPEKQSGHTLREDGYCTYYVDDLRAQSAKQPRKHSQLEPQMNAGRRITDLCLSIVITDMVLPEMAESVRIHVSQFDSNPDRLKTRRRGIGIVTINSKLFPTRVQIAPLIDSISPHPVYCRSHGLGLVRNDTPSCTAHKQKYIQHKTYTECVLFAVYTPRAGGSASSESSNSSVNID
ncbi:hypothetical protein EVAR_25420_1 [Eumeta japonica]|uniref:Uncharacterized protein n=1 Tax=Eumeta variegata TaxID=151549 RepID=A0A4C1V5E6_EUMVA|nr:hypothetical protein EVAR_25420_1 [Eumeta japonica]